MINLKVSAEKNLTAPQKIVAVLMALASYNACKKNSDPIPQMSYLDRAEVITKFPKEILSMSRFIDYFYGGIKITEIKTVKNPANSKMQYEILIDTRHRIDIKKSLEVIFKDYIKHLSVKYPGFTFKENIKESKIVVTPE